jgi:DNA-binding response OmpR family regulator
MMSEIKINIIMVEDDPEILRLNGRLLARRGFTTAAAGSLAQARALLNSQRFDLVILDVNLPDGNGYELCRELRSTGQQDLPIVFLTGRGQTRDKVDGLEVGGDYYLVKPYSFDELFAVIQRLTAKTAWTLQQIAEATTITRGPLTLQIPSGKAFVRGRDAGLTPKEFAILLLLIQNEEREVTGEMIYESVWETPQGNNTEALRQHISRLKKKLDEENTDAFTILNERGRGYTFTTK